MKKREYQAEMVDAVVEDWKTSDSTLIDAATGTGKTITFAHIIKRMFPRRALILANRKELVHQAADKVHRVTGYEVAIEMGDIKIHTNQHNFINPQVVVSSVQTMCSGGDGGGRMYKFDPKDFGIVIIDEAHLSITPSFKRVLDFFRTNQNLKILGVTATPKRSDEKALGQLYKSVAYSYPLTKAIHDGWLVEPLQCAMYVHDLDFSHISTTDGDLNGPELAKVMEQEHICHEVVSGSLQEIGNQKAIAFTQSVRQAELMAEIFNRNRPGMAAWVCGKTPEDERKKINEMFRTGQIQILCNCGTHTHGFDDPGIHYIINAKPTKSETLYKQIVGRATRPSESIAHLLNDMPDADARRELIAKSEKPFSVVLDFIGTNGRHKLVNTGDILGGDYDEDVIEIFRERMEKRRDARPMKTLEELEKIKQELEEKRLHEQAKKAQLVAKAKYTKKYLNPFDVLDIEPARMRGWDEGRSLSEGQCKILLGAGIDPESIDYAKGKQLCSQVIMRYKAGLCTLRMGAILKKNGYDPNMKMAEAKATIDKIAKEQGWGKRK